MTLPTAVVNALRSRLDKIDGEIGRTESACQHQTRELANDQAKLLALQMVRAEIATFLGPDEEGE